MDRKHPFLLPPSSEAADSEPLAKRQKLCPRKVCITCFCEFADGDYYYYILIFDLDSRRNSSTNTNLGDDDQEFIPMAPTLRLKCEDLSGFCLLGSRLYLFESDNLNSDPPRKSVYTIDLSSYDWTKHDLKLAKSELGKAPDMMHAKRTPQATPTPDGKKILVFSSVIHLKLSAETAGENDFELYDPDAKTWQQLPGIHYDWGSLSCRYSYTYFWIHTFTFISMSTFFLVSETGLMFVLDLASLDKGWQKWDSFFGTSPIPFPLNAGPFLVIEDELCLTSSGVYDIKRGNQFPESFGNQIPEWFYFPRISCDKRILRRDPSSVTLLDDVNNGQFSFCTLETGKIGKTWKIRDMGCPHLIINVYNCDLTKYRKDKGEMGGFAELFTSICTVESFKYVLDAEQCIDFFPLAMFSI